ncbi:extracellular solute-binding protein [Phytoactinopolyspora alkaliphila]|uniref:Extracellular solute-binding protein n=1 Tax=Phytoactinopolyspora alkaliphila TaxID=1783498 RepID=A0A6N9YTL4_9ACTN|nr:extracellular solute-binding protein [Phytoactinopolyspora alkaliphila]NED98393.1 extracellular solute-binding protein [Phytoactinopolyspora alkaliphila]
MNAATARTSLQPWKKGSLALISGLLVLTACGSDDGAADDADGGEGSAEEIVLDFPSWQANEPGHGEALAAIIEEFESRHEGVTVNLYAVSNEDFQNQIVTRLSAGDPPDIIPSGNHFFAFAATGQLEPLNDRLEASGLLDEWESFQSERVVDGDHLALTMHALTRMLYVNEEYLDDAGLDGPPTSPQELSAAVDTLAANLEEGVSPWGATTTTHSNLFGESTAFIVGMGSQWIVDGEWAVTAPATVEAIELYRSLATQAPPGLDGGGYRQLLADGRVAMSQDGSWVIATLDDTAPEDIRPSIAAAVPPFENTLALVGTSLSIPAGISDERKDLAWEFIQVAAEPEFQGQWAGSIDAAPGRTGSIPQERIDERPELAIVADTIASAQPEFPDSENFRANFGEIETRIIDAMMRLLTTDADTLEVLTDLENQLAGITEP